MTQPVRPRWVDAALQGRPPAPTVLVLGGFITSPPLYRPFVRALERRGVAAVVIANVWTPDWLLAARFGFGRIVTRSGRSLLAAASRSAVLSDDAPLLLIGHSAGGISARLLTAPVPFDGRRLNASGRIGAIVTLGTPHVVAAPGASGARRAGRSGAQAAAFANREVPGPAFAPRIGYLAIASRAVVGRRDGTDRERARWRMYDTLLPEPADPEVEGDGLIPVRSALLPGAPSIVYDDVEHGQWPGRPWYGSEPVLDRWWASALGCWQSAVQARAEADFDGSPDRR